MDKYRGIFQFPKTGHYVLDSLKKLPQKESSKLFMQVVCRALPEAIPSCRFSC